MTTKTDAERDAQQMLVEKLESKAWWVIPSISEEAIELTATLWERVQGRDDDMQVLCSCCCGGIGVALVRKQAVPAAMMAATLHLLFLEHVESGDLRSQDVLIVTDDEDPLPGLKRASGWARWLQEGLTEAQLSVLAGRHN